MKLRIDTVHGREDAYGERVLMTALQDCNLCYYMIADTTYTAAGKISNKHRHIKWFDPLEVKGGERVALYTGKGNYAKEVHSGTTWHKIYWNSGTNIWNDDADAAVLFEIHDWNTTPSR